MFYNCISYFLNIAGSLFRPVHVSGFLDDLIGQQIAIYFILFVLTLSLIFLLFGCVLNNFIMLNKDRILKRFNNKYIKLYIGYQSLLIKISLIYVPILMLIGLSILAHGFYFLITHPLPVESLNVDLHTYLDSNSKSVNSSLILCTSLAINMDKSSIGLKSPITINTYPLITSKFSNVELDPTKSLKTTDLVCVTGKGKLSVTDLINENNMRDNFFRDYIKVSGDSDIIYINSPIEPTALTNLLSDLTTILNYNLFVNLTISYLIVVTIFAFTVRYVLNTDLLLNKILTWPLGKYAHFVLRKLINIWKNSSVLLIYFLLFSILIFSLCSSYAIYACLFGLN